MTEVRSDAAGTIDTTAPAESIGGYALWEVYDDGETFWMAVRDGESAISLLADEHGLSMEDMAEAEAHRTSIAVALTKRIGDEDRPGVTQTLWEAFGAMVADLSAGRSATRCVGATVW